MSVQRRQTLQAEVIRQAQLCLKQGEVGAADAQNGRQYCPMLAEGCGREVIEGESLHIFLATPQECFVLKESFVQGRYCFALCRFIRDGIKGAPEAENLHDGELQCVAQTLDMRQLEQKDWRGHRNAMVVHRP